MSTQESKNFSHYAKKVLGVIAPIIGIAVLIALALYGSCGTVKVSDWEYEEVIDPIDDSLTKSIITRSDNAVLSVFCGPEDDLTVGVVWIESIGEGTSTVIYRIGDEEPVQTYWRAKAQSMFIFPQPKHWKTEEITDPYFDPEACLTLLKSIVDESQIAVRATKHDQTDITATFNIKGFELSVRPILEYCHVDLGD